MDVSADPYLMTKYVDKAHLLAIELHATQKDKSGAPYIGHLGRVAKMVERSNGNWVQVCAAWLHDSIEDTTATADWLLGAGMPSMVVEMVQALTHEPRDKPNIEYWEDVKSLRGAVLVKTCDIYDNLDPSRMCYLDAATQTRLILKYADALRYLHATN